jgi:hypothetical protein
MPDIILRQADVKLDRATDEHPVGSDPGWDALLADSTV